MKKRHHINNSAPEAQPISTLDDHALCVVSGGEKYVPQPNTGESIYKYMTRYGQWLTDELNGYVCKPQ